MWRSGETRALARHWFPLKLALLSLYFGLLLVPKAWPGFADNGVFILYLLSIPFALLGFVGLAVWGVVGVVLARRRGSIVSQRHRKFVVVSLAALLVCGFAMALAQAIRGALPTGSYTEEFVSSVWQQPTSIEFSPDDFSMRQKMLGSLVTRLSVLQDRAELEALLGPSLETQYFKNTGRDLIYILGPERDSFVRIDSEWLLIWLDDSGHFERYEIRTD